MRWLQHTMLVDAFKEAMGHSYHLSVITTAKLKGGGGNSCREQY